MVQKGLLGSQKNLFDIVKPKIFKDMRWVDPDFHPLELPYRENEIQSIVYTLGPSLKQKARPLNIFIYGHPSQGKTAVIMRVIEDLQTWSEREGLAVKTFYIRCRDLKRYTATAVLDEFVYLCTGKHKYGGTFYQMSSMFLEKIEEMKCPVVIVLDDIHRIKEDEIESLFNLLSRAGQSFKSPKTTSTVTFIAITNDPKITRSLRQETMSSLYHTSESFNPYTTQQVVDILKYRCKEAFQPGTINNTTIGHVAKKSVMYSRADVRYGLQLLKEAGRLAERKGLKEINEDLLPQAHSVIERDMILNALRGIGSIGHLVLGSIFYLKGANGDSDVISGQIYDFVDKITSKDCKISMSQISQIITGLEQEQKMIRTQRPVNAKGNTRAIILEEEPNNIKIVLRDALDSLFTMLNNTKEASQFIKWINN